MKPHEIGSEKTPAEFVAKIVAVAEQVKRVLREDGTFWLNIGDSYAGGGGGNYGNGKSVKSQGGEQVTNVRNRPEWLAAAGMRAKSLCLVPQRLVLALADAGWYVRSVIRWFKVSPMPEPVRDRPTSAVEEILLLTKTPTYFYDQEAQRREISPGNDGSCSVVQRKGGTEFDENGKPVGAIRVYDEIKGGNLWNWWAIDEEGSGSWFIPNEPLKAAHYAAFPSELARRCISLGTSAHGCCPACGAPYRRVTERSKVKRERPNEHVKRTGEQGTGNVCGNTVAGVAVETTGWEAGCGCNAGEPQPCRILDPFAGAGTTLLAALRMGRQATGIELNQKYIDLARKRLVADNPLFNGFGH